MALAIRPLVQAPALTFSPSPFVGSELWREGIDLFHHWAAGQFTPGKVYPDYLMAERMDVHRVIADAWLLGLVQAKLAEDRTILLNARVGDSPEAPGFRLRPVPGTQRNIKVMFGELHDYDPWVDDSMDEELPDARFPDMYIDKYYLVTLNEYYVYNRKSRKRPNRSTFSPLSLDEHPRYAIKDSAKARREIEGQRPPEQWRAVINELTSG